MNRPLPLLFSLLLAGYAAAAPPDGSLLRTFKVGGEGRWDYLTVESAKGRLFVPRSTRVMVLDLDGHPQGEIPDTPGVHGVALAPELDRGWTSNGQANSVTVFKLSTLAVEKVVAIRGQNPDAILYDPATHQVFIFNGRSKDVTVLDAASSAVKGTIPVAGKPEFAATDGGGTVYCNDEDHATIIALDAAALKVKATWSLAPLESPTGLAIDTAHRRLFSVGGNSLAAVVDADTGKVLATVKTGSGTDGVAYDPGTGCAYASNGEGTITVIRREGPDRYTTATIPTRRGARTLALDPRSHRLYLPTAEFAAATPGGARPAVVPGSFQILEVGPPR